MQTSSHQWSADVTKAPLKLEEKVYRPPNEDLLLAEDSDDEAAAKVQKSAVKNFRQSLSFCRVEIVLQVELFW